MKRKIIFLMFIFFNVITILAQDPRQNTEIKYSLKNVRAITDEGGFSNPKWSPDGTKIFVTTPRNNGIYLINLETGERILLTDIAGSGYNAEWSFDSKNIFFRENISDSNHPMSLESRSINIESKIVTKQLQINPDGIASSISARQNKDPVVYTNMNTLLIEGQSLDKTKKWVITTEPGQYYQAILSPDKSKVIVHRGDEMLVYFSDGKGLINSLGNGFACGWSSDSKSVLFYLEKDDGYKITGSDLFICNVDGSHKWQITNTPDIYEMSASFSPDNYKIVYTDEKSGKIFIADIHRN